MVINTVYHFVDSNLGLKYLQKRGVNRKRVPSNRRSRHLCTLVLVFQKIFMQRLSDFLLLFGNKMNRFQRPYFLPSLDYWILLICLAITQIRGKHTQQGYCWCVLRGELWKLFWLGWGANDLTWGRKGLHGGTGIGNYTD